MKKAAALIGRLPERNIAVFVLRCLASLCAGLIMPGAVLARGIRPFSAAFAASRKDAPTAVAAAMGAFTGCILSMGRDGLAPAAAVLASAAAARFLCTAPGRRHLLPLCTGAAVLLTGVPFGGNFFALLSEALISAAACGIMLGRGSAYGRLCAFFCTGLGIALGLEPFRLFGLFSPAACFCALGVLASSRISGRSRGAAFAAVSAAAVDLSLGFPCLFTPVLGLGAVGASVFKTPALSAAAFSVCAAVPALLWGERGLFCLAQCLFGALAFLFVPEKLTRPPVKVTAIHRHEGGERLLMLSKAVEALGDSLPDGSETEKLVKLQCEGIGALLNGEEMSHGKEERDRIAAIASAYCPDARVEWGERDGGMMLRISPNIPDPDAFIRSAEEGPGIALRYEDGVFFQKEKLVPKLYCAVRRRSGEAACGDTLSHIRTRDGRAVVLLSDGMGAGDGAEMLSSGAVGLIEGFVEAGADIYSAASAVLPSLTAAFDTRGFVTLDLLEIELYTGKATMVRMGAAPAWLFSEGKLKRIPGRGLPAGAEAGPPPPPITFHPSPGDLLLMVTDGACEDPSAPAGLIGRVSPEKLPGMLISAAAASGNHDDMTAVAVVF